MSVSKVILTCAQYEFIGEKVCEETRGMCMRERKKGVCVTL